VGSQPQAGDRVGGRYRLSAPLAAGGMGAVWRAQHEELGVEVAIKLIAPELLSAPQALARFQREARAAARLRSPHVVQVHDYGFEDGRPFLAMELMQGEDLRSLLNREKHLSPERAEPIVTGVCKALAVAHEAGIVHRDLKPANVFIARTGGDEVTKILDFGVAKDLNAVADTVRTASDALIGSPRYMSPEQVRGAALDHRSDLWSLAVVIYEALTGVHPFAGDTVGDVLLKISVDDVVPPSSRRPGLPVGLDAFFERALARRPDERFDAALDVLAAYRRILAGGPALLPAEPTSPTPPPPRATARGRADATVDVEPTPDERAAAASAVSVVQPLDTTASAVEARVEAAAPRPRRTLWIGAALAVVAGVAVAAVVVPGPEGRRDATGAATGAPEIGASDTSAPRPGPPPEPPPAAATAAPVEEPGGALAASASPEPRPSASGPRVTPQRAAGPSRAPPEPPRPSAPPAAPVDPIFGLPTGTR
jgi:hypothetical protein